MAMTSGAHSMSVTARSPTFNTPEEFAMAGPVYRLHPADPLTRSSAKSAVTDTPAGSCSPRLDGTSTQLVPSRTDGPATGNEVDVVGRTVLDRGGRVGW